MHRVTRCVHGYLVVGCVLILLLGGVHRLLNKILHGEVVYGCCPVWAPLLFSLSAGVPFYDVRRINLYYSFVVDQRHCPCLCTNNPSTRIQLQCISSPFAPNEIKMEEFRHNLYRIESSTEFLTYNSFPTKAHINLFRERILC